MCRGASVEETVRRSDACQNSNSFFFVVERAAIRALGESEARVRLLAVVAGALVPLFGWLGTSRAFGARAGAVALLLLALDPLLVHQAESARPYSLGHLGAAVAFLGLVRALETGSLGARALLWGGAVLAIYAHYIFAPIIPAIVVAVLASRRPTYRPSQLLADVALATLALAPALRHMSLVFGRRQAVGWVTASGPAAFGSMVPPRTRWLILGGVAMRLLPGRLSVPASRGALVFALACPGIVALWFAALLLFGSSLLDERYMVLGTVTLASVSGWALAACPRPVAAVAVALACVLGVREYHERRWDEWRQEWREAAADLRALAPAPDEPILAKTGFVEATRVTNPARLSAEVRGFLASPLEDQPGHPEDPRRRYLPLAFAPRTRFEGEPPYFETDVAPALAPARRFFLVAPPSYKADFDGWLEERFPGRFECARTSRVYLGPAVVAVYRAR